MAQEPIESSWKEYAKQYEIHVLKALTNAETLIDEYKTPQARIGNLVEGRDKRDDLIKSWKQCEKDCCTEIKNGLLAEAHTYFEDHVELDTQEIGELIYFYIENAVRKLADGQIIGQELAQEA
jgi:hypothetical protein